jgi:apolipoprotein N-acyltransferase
MKRSNAIYCFFKKIINYFLPLKATKISSFILGLLNFLASNPINFTAVLFFTFGTILIAIYNRNKIKDRYLLFLSFIFGHFVGQFYWLAMPLRVDIENLFYFIPLAIAGVPFFITLIFSPFIFIGLIVYSKLNIKSLTLLSLFLTLGYSTAEHIRANYIFGGFPWGLFGHFADYTLLMQILHFINTEIFSSLFMLLVFSLFIFLKGNKFDKIYSSSIILIWIIISLYGIIVLIRNPVNKPNSDGIFIAANQGNFPPTNTMSINSSLDNVRESMSDLRWAQGLKGKTLVLLSEAIINFPLENHSNVTRYFGSILPNNNSLFIAGSITEENSKIYNTIHFIDRNGYIIAIYKKHKLVPFGEYIPLRKYLPKFIKNIVSQNGDFSPQKENNIAGDIIYYKDMPYLLPIICYESIFSEAIKQRIDYYNKMIKDQLEPNDQKKSQLKLIINLTNDVWMGNTIGPYQHLTMSRFTAVRSKTAMLRISNNGISALIDSFGRIITKTTLNKKAIFTAHF